MTATMTKAYDVKTFTLSGLAGLSQEQLDQHYKLYAGYVNRTNVLNDKLAQLIAEGKAGTPEYQELKRRFGFEYSGMRLHEYYFANMQPNGGSVPTTGKLADALVASFGSLDNFVTDFKKTGAMPGIGWAILFQDTWTGKLQTFWVNDHENGHPVGFAPILVMDVWEHAYTVDYKPTERPNYIDAFFNNINWTEVESRLK
jgi:superoxide dismutase, Fe-Mn family